MIIFNYTVEQTREWLKSLTLEFVLGWGDPNMCAGSWWDAQTPSSHGACWGP